MRSTILPLYLLLVLALLLAVPGVVNGFGLRLLARVNKAVQAKVTRHTKTATKEEGVLVCDTTKETLSIVPTKIKVIHSPDANPHHVHEHPLGILKHKKKKDPAARNAHLVHFSASKTITTAAMPHSETLQDFFQLQETCECLFSAEASLETIEHPSDELVELFRDKRPSPLRTKHEVNGGSHSSARKPQAIATRYVALTNPPMGFAGLQLYSVAYVAIQILHHDFTSHIESANRKGLRSPSKILTTSTNMLPEFQYTLLTTCFRAEGPNFMVWLFEKLMGTAHHDKTGPTKNHSIPTSRLDTSGFTSVSAQLVAQDDLSGIRFCNTAQLEGSIRIPRALLTMLPMCVGQLESQGSRTIQTAVEQDMEPAMERLQATYREWLARLGSPPSSRSEMEMTGY